MAERLHPGVYVEEVSSGIRPIEGVSTSTAAFIGESGRGIPAMAHFLTSYDEFESTLGGHLPDEKGFLAEAVQAFFDLGGVRAYVVRVLPSDAAFGQSATVPTTFTAPVGTPQPQALYFRAKGAGVWADALRVNLGDSTHFPGEAFKVTLNWVEAGTTKLLETYDDVRMDLTSEDYFLDVINRSSDYIQVADQFEADVTAAVKAWLPIPEQGPVLVATAGTYHVEKGATLLFQWWNGSPDTGVTSGSITFPATADLATAALVTALTTALGTHFHAIANGTNVEIRADVASRAYLAIVANSGANFDLGATTDKITLTATNLAGASGVHYDVAGIAGTMTPADLVTAFQTAIAAATDPYALTFEVIQGAILVRSGRLAGGVKLDLDLTHLTIATKPTVTKLADGRAGVTVESLDAVQLTIAEKRQALVKPILRGLKIAPTARGYVENSPANPLVLPVQQTNLLVGTGSDGGTPLSVSDYIGDPIQRTGLRAFDTVDVNLVSIPGQWTPEFINAGIAYCEQRHDCFFIADGPGMVHGDFEMLADEARDFVQALPNRSNNAAMYFPWIQVPDPVGVGRNPTRWAPPSGFVAGIYARTDINRGVWKAPAGLETTVNGALDLQTKLLDAGQDLLNPIGLNCLRQFPNTGIIVWGARTIASDPEWRYVPVRRMALFLRSSLLNGLKWAVFEPNDQNLWDQIRVNISQFMLGLFRQGAFQGATPAEAFLVRCDRSTNPQDSVDAGIVTAQVSFAPLKPAEFVVIEISQKSLVG